MVRQTGSFDHGSGQTMHLKTIVFRLTISFMNNLLANLFLIL